MKLTTRIATMIVATDPIILPITNAVGVAASHIAGFGLEIAMEVAALRQAKVTEAIEKARIRATQAGAPRTEILKAELDSDNPVSALNELADRWTRTRENVTAVKSELNTVVTGFNLKDL